MFLLTRLSKEFGSKLCLEHDARESLEPQQVDQHHLDVPGSEVVAPGQLHILASQQLPSSSLMFSSYLILQPVLPGEYHSIS